VAEVTAGPALFNIAGFGLPGHDRRPVRVAKEEWPAFLQTVELQRLTGLAMAAAGSGSLELSDEQWDELVDHHADAMLWALIVERKLLSLAGQFEEAGIEVVALKGSTMAHTVYPDPSWRPFADVDVLVRTADWRRSCDLLASLGFGRRLPEPRPGFDERFGKAAVHTNGDGVEIDLHRTLVLGPFGLWLDPEDLFRRSVPLRIGGSTVRRLDDTALLLHACIHASLGWAPPLLLPLRDVAQVATHGRIDWEEFERLALKWRLRSVAGHAFQNVAATLEVELPAPAIELARVEPSRKEQRLLAAYTTGRRFRGGTATSTLRAIPGLRVKAAYVWALVFPRRDFLDRRASARGSYWRRWLIPVRWVTRRRG
jgi:Uncharacterised nucleotidyltransferase